MATRRTRRKKVSWLSENTGMIVAVLGLAGAGLVFLGYFGGIRFPYFGGMRMPWHDINFMLTKSAGSA
jgi:hypothetical protein